MSDLTPETLAELRRLAEAATPGPWEAFGAVDGRRGERWLGVTTDMRATESARAGDVFAAQNCTRQDALFIAAANPAAVLALLDDADALRAELAHMTEARDNARAEVERLTAKVERVRAMHRPAYNDAARSPLCPDCAAKAGVHPCGCWADTDYEPVCAVCNEGHKGMSVPWPCPTIRALDEEPQP